MTKLDSCVSSFPFLVRSMAVSVLAICCVAYGQTYYSPNQQVRIHDLLQVTARSRHGSDVLAASVEIVFQDREVRCGKDSALEDRILMADPKSLQDVGDKLRGRQLLTDGRPIMVTADYAPAASVDASLLIGDLRKKQPLLMEWNSHLYVIYGVIFDESVDSSSGITDAIHKILLLDPRYSDARREVVFDRLTDDWASVQGVLVLKAEPK
jgi:hypothetical protein